jgi:lipopolysaccharide export system protein LptA
MKPPVRLLFALLAAAPALAAAEPATDTTISSENATSVRQGDRTVMVCTGDVVVTSGELRVTCDYLKAITLPPAQGAPGGQPSFQYLLATGHVHIVQGDRDATCGRAEMFPPEGKVVLTGNPVLTDPAKGTRAAYDRLVLWRDGSTEGTGFHAVAPPLKELQLGAGAPPSPAPPHPGP